ncbi:2-(3-amino-3-carboxypropyl)histidine synthase subunit 2-like protein [Tanacetum coccineum]
MVNLLPQQFKSLRKVHKGLIRRYKGPFPVIERVGKVSYRVQLPSKLKIHQVFHVSFLKPYHGEEEDPKRGVSKRAPTAVVTLYDREVEKSLSDQTIRRRGVPSYKEYLIKWRDLPDSESSWEAEDLLWQFTDEIKRYHEDGTTRTSQARLILRGFMDSIRRTSDKELNPIEVEIEQFLEKVVVKHLEREVVIEVEE